MKRKIGQYVGAVFGVAVLAALAWFAVTYHKEIWLLFTQQSARDSFAQTVRESGAAGLTAFLGLQVLQVVVAFIPGEPVQLMAGALYGTLGGLAVCLVGLVVGSVAVYYVVRLMGASCIDPALLHKYRFLRDDEHVHFFLFLLYFLPGLPKDVLLYLGPFLPVKPAAFFAITTLARIPALVASTYVGANLIEGDWKPGLVVFLIAGALALLCLWQQEHLLRRLRTWREKSAQPVEKDNKM